MPSSELLHPEVQDHGSTGTPSLSGILDLVPMYEEFSEPLHLCRFWGGSRLVISDAAGRLDAQLLEVLEAFCDSPAYSDFFEHLATGIDAGHHPDLEYEVVPPAQHPRRIRVIPARVRRASRPWTGLGLTPDDVVGLAHGDG